MIELQAGHLEPVALILSEVFAYVGNSWAVFPYQTWNVSLVLQSTFLLPLLSFLGSPILHTSLISVQLPHSPALSDLNQHNKLTQACSSDGTLCLDNVKLVVNNFYHIHILNSLVL